MRVEEGVQGGSDRVRAEGEERGAGVEVVVEEVEEGVVERAGERWAERSGGGHAGGEGRIERDGRRKGIRWFRRAKSRAEMRER